ncbi:hypothetical protein KSS87_004257, partial [Heliosperma pusillum]
FTSLNLTLFLSHLLLPFFLLFPFSSKCRILRIVLPIILMILQSCVLLPYNLIERVYSASHGHSYYVRCQRIDQRKEVDQSIHQSKVFFVLNLSYISVLLKYPLNLSSKGAIFFWFTVNYL